MASYYQFNTHLPHPTSSSASTLSHNHHGRNRRAPRLSVSQNAQKQFRGVRSMKDLTETTALSTFRQKFELVRGFDLEDDLEFCPGLLTESDLVSIHSGSSERSSLASNSPTGSPKEVHQQPTPAFALNASPSSFVPPQYLGQQASLKLHQPAATRTRNAIPIINPLTGFSMSSPPPSVSPDSRMQQGSVRRW